MTASGTADQRAGTRLEPHIRASRTHIARSRGALSGILLLILGAWAALAPFIGPYFDFGFAPKPSDSWHWTTDRGWLEVLPGAVAFAGGLVLLLSASRVATSLAAWLAAAAGAWLIVGPPLSPIVKLHPGGPDPSKGVRFQALEELCYFFAIGAAILLVAALALGRLSVHSLRDVRAAESRAESERLAAEEAERNRVRADQERQQRADRDRAERARAESDREPLDRERQQREGEQPQQGSGPGYSATAAGAGTAGEPPQQYPPQGPPPQYPPQGSPQQGPPTQYPTQGPPPQQYAPPQQPPDRPSEP